MALNTVIPCLPDGINSALAQLGNENLRQINEIRIRKNMPLILIFGKNSFL
ncbi:MAG: hypothetical protein LIO43_06375 [Clostridiales bacterium]|nr:hypothetical protein [Clostridiales bacterium]